MAIFDLERTQQAEVGRRLKLLGKCASGDCNSSQLRDRSRETFVPVKYLAAWRHAYRLHGSDGLLPRDWIPLNERSQHIVLPRLEQLAPLADAEFVTTAQIKDLATQNGWSDSKAERWVRRYRIGGLWALAPKHDPCKQSDRSSRKHPPPTLGAIEPDEFDDAFDEVMRRYRIIKPLLHKAHIPNTQIERRAKKAKISPRTLRYYLKGYRTYGFAGLIPKSRSDKGQYHNLSDRMVHVIGGIRLSKYDMPLHEVLEQACEKARLLGEPEPSEWQVRAVCKALPDAVTMIADGRLGDFRSSRRITYRRYFDGTLIIYQIDWTPVDVLIKDMRGRGYGKKRGETRPYLMVCMDASSRLVLAAIFTYDIPNTATVASVIRDALLKTEKKPYGGIPDAIWVDRGQQMISKRVQQIAQEQRFDLHDCIPLDREDRGNPQEKGIIERFIKTLNTRLWATLSGYVHSNTVKRNPNAKAALTITELADRFWNFVEQYHHEVHEELGMTPLEYWAEHCHTTGVNPRNIDTLLPEAEYRDVIAEGIKYAGRVYWNADLQEEFVPIGTRVLVRSQPKYTRPDEIVVYYKGQRICTATARDSQAGRAVTGQQVAIAQRRQKKAIKGFIEQERATVKEADREIEDQKRQSGASAGQHPPSSEPQPGSTTTRSPASKSTRKQRADVWDELLEGSE
jgi:putative transposase